MVEATVIVAEAVRITGVIIEVAEEIPKAEETTETMTTTEMTMTNSI